MAVIKLKDLSKFIDSKSKKLFSELKKDTNLKGIAILITERIRTRTRLGFGVFKNYKARQKLAPLAPSTLASRKNKKNLSGMTTRKKSNLTETGKMLDKLIYRIKSGVIRIFINDGKREEIAGYHHAGNSKLPQRPFLYLSDIELKATQKKLNILIKKLLKIFK